MKAIWSNGDGIIYTGLVIHGQKLPLREFRTFAEFISHVEAHQAELMLLYTFIERYFEETAGTLSDSILKAIENIKEIDKIA